MPEKNVTKTWAEGFLPAGFDSEFELCDFTNSLKKVQTIFLKKESTDRSTICTRSVLSNFLITEENTAILITSYRNRNYPDSSHDFPVVSF